MAFLDLIKMLVSQNVAWPVLFYISFHIQVGNKCDKEGERMVSREEGQKCARKYQMMFIEVCALLDLMTKVYHDLFQASAKTKEGVQCAFEELVEKIIQTPGLWESQDKRGAINVTGGGEAESQGACGGYCSML